MKNIVNKLMVIIFVCIVLLNATAFAGKTISPELQKKLSNVIVLYVGNSESYVNSNKVDVDSANLSAYPFMRDERTLIPIKFISKYLNAKVEFNKKINEVKINVDDKNIKFVLGKKSIFVNEVEKEIDVSSQFVNGNIYIPVRAFMEALGKQVFWDDRGLIIISESNNIFDETSEKSLFNDIDKYITESENNIVSINGQQVSIEEFKLILSMIKSDMEMQGVIDFDMIIGAKKAIDLAKEGTLNAITQYKLENQKAIEKDVTLNDLEISKIDDTVNTIAYINPQILEEIKNKEYSINNVRNAFIQFNIANKFKQKTLNDFMNTLNVTNKEAFDYYNTNKELYRVNQEVVRVKHILVRTIDDKNNLLSDQEGIKKKAQDILAKAKSGVNFAALAKEYSEDTGSKNNGGEYIFSKGKMVKEFEDASFALKPNEICGLVKTVYGYHIIKLEEKVEKGQIISFAALKDNIKLNLKQQKVLQHYNEMIKDLVKNAQIIKNDKLYNSIK